MHFTWCDCIRLSGNYGDWFPWLSISDRLWWVSQSQKCLSYWVIQAHKDWVGGFRATEQAAKSPGCVRKCYRYVTVDDAFLLEYCRQCIYFWFAMYLSFVWFCVGASEPRNMAYMNRLGIWGEGTPFKEFTNFIQAVERRWVYQKRVCVSDLAFWYQPAFSQYWMQHCFGWFILEVSVPWRLLPWIWSWEGCTLLDSWASQAWRLRLKKLLWRRATSRCTTNQSAWWVKPFQGSQSACLVHTRVRISDLYNNWISHCVLNVNPLEVFEQPSYYSLPTEGIIDLLPKHWPKLTRFAAAPSHRIIFLQYMYVC